MSFLAACFLIGIMGVREFYNGFKSMDVKPNFAIACIAAAALYVINLFGEKYEWYMLWFFGCVLASLLYLFNIEHRKLEDAMATVTGIFYVVVFFIPRYARRSGRALQQSCMAYSHNGFWN